MTRNRSDRRPPATAGAPSPPSDGGVDRRALLAGAGSAVVAGLGAPAPGAAQTTTAAPTSSRRIDAHTHFSSLKFLDALEKEDGKPFVLSGMYRSKPALTEVKPRLAILDHNEVDIHVLVPVP